MAEDETSERGNKLGKTAEGFVKGSKSYNVTVGNNYRIDVKSTGKVSVMDIAGPGKPQPVIRLDKAHAGYDYNHINLNPKYSKLTTTVTTPSGNVKTVPYDPHTKLPPGGLAAGEATAKLCKYVNAANVVLVPVAIAVDTYRVGCAAYNDYNNGSTRNTVGTGVSMVGGWAGGYGGSLGGAAIGTAILPGIGTIVGGIIGGLSGGITGAIATGKVADAVCDKVEYNIVETECESCKEKFKARKYLGEKCCPRCTEKLIASKTEANDECAKCKEKFDGSENGGCQLCVEKLPTADNANDESTVKKIV